MERTGTEIIRARGKRIVKGSSIDPAASLQQEDTRKLSKFLAIATKSNI